MSPPDDAESLPYPDVPFHQPSRAEWRARVESELGEVPFATLSSRTTDGLEIAPLYTAEDLPGEDAAGAPGRPPYARGTRAAPATPPWRIAFEARRWPGGSLAPEVAAGADLLWLVFGSDGMPLAAADHLATLLEGVDLATTAVQLDAGDAATATAAALVALARRRGVATGDLRGGLGADPLAALARDGEIAASLDAAWEDVADLATWCRDEAPGLRATLVSASPVHDAGGGAVEELAWLLAGGVETLRRLVGAGFEASAAAAQIRFATSAGPDLFLAIAKLRAARLLWAKAVAAAGGDAAAQAMDLHVRVSAVHQTVYDPWGNLLRGTGEAFAAAVGGAASLAVAPFDEAAGRARAASRRLAINTQHVLAEEAHLGDVLDPAGGSYYLESLTDRLARAAWERFREIEAAGGLGVAVTSGDVARRVAATAAEERRRLLTRRRPILGVSEFPQLDGPTLPADAPPPPPPVASGERVTLEPAGEGRRTASAIAAAVAGRPATAVAAARGSEPTRAPALEPWRRSAPFEALRARTDRAGRRPRVFLATVGSPAEIRARLGWTENLLAVAGLEAAVCAPCETAAEAAAAYAESGADAAVIVASDARWPELVPVLAPILAERGGPVLLAGRPGEHEESFRRAGVERFLFAGDDAVAALGELLDVLLPERATETGR